MKHRTPWTAAVRSIFLAAGLLLAAWLTACSSAGTRVVLLPQANGQPSSVIVHAAGGELALTRPYQRAVTRLDSRDAPQLDDVDAARVQAAYPLLFQLEPPPPVRYTVYFVAGGTVLTLESVQVMHAALADAQGRSGGDIVITGHTDTKGSGTVNDELSAQRAREVRQLFIDRQFPAARIESAGRGERELAVPTADEVDEPRNRRVVIEVR